MFKRIRNYFLSLVFGWIRWDDTAVLEVIKADITKLEVDAIVNAAKNSLLGGGGVDGAIHQAAGPGLLEECRQIGGCQTGFAVITKAYNLPAKHVIHTVGPVWNGGNEDEARLLAECYVNSLKLAATANLETVAFPAISCGVYGYPIDQAAKIAVNTCTAFLKLNTSVKHVYLVCFDDAMYDILSKTLEK